MVGPGARENGFPVMENYHEQALEFLEKARTALDPAMAAAYRRMAADLLELAATQASRQQQHPTTSR
jgi:hypothetical protein